MEISYNDFFPPSLFILSCYCPCYFLTSNRQKSKKKIVSSPVSQRTARFSEWGTRFCKRTAIDDKGRDPVSRIGTLFHELGPCFTHGGSCFPKGGPVTFYFILLVYLFFYQYFGENLFSGNLVHFGNWFPHSGNKVAFGQWAYFAFPKTAKAGEKAGSTAPKPV